MIITTVESENYGSYHLEAIGVFSPKNMFNYFPEGEKGVDCMVEWNEKYHPRTFFKCFSFIHLGDPKDNYSDSIFLVPSQRVNLEWKENNLELAKKFKLKKLPITISDEKIEKWQKTLPQHIILPDYFLQSGSIEEIKEKWKIANQ